MFTFDNGRCDVWDNNANPAVPSITSSVDDPSSKLFDPNAETR